MYMMKCDVVCCFYKQQLSWPLLRWGFNENAAFIEKVIVVNDGPAEELDVLRELEVPLVRLGHEKKGFGLAKSANQGIAASTTDFVLLVEGDEILPSDSLARSILHAEDGLLLCCRKRYIDYHTHILDLPNVKFVEEDHRGTKWKWECEPTEKWKMCSGGHLLISRYAHDLIGGFDESYEYGLHDYDYAARWMARFGKDAVVFGPQLGEVWHIGNNAHRTNPTPSEESQRRFENTLRTTGLMR